ncbi:MAG: outer membrane beta-barrel protein [Vicinamibacterales bacterium]
MSLCIAGPRLAAAQNVGAGPLTETLAATEPTSGVFNWGPVKLAPGLVVEELGWDSNVFDEHDNPKEDYVFRGTPDVSVFSVVRFAKLSLYAGSELAYYRTYTNERSVGHEYRGRVDFLISRMHPFFGGGETRSRTRPNGEIDTRADRNQQELSGGFAFDLGPNQLVYAAASRYRSKFFNAVEEGVELSTALNHDSNTYSLGVKTDLTPLTSLTVYAAYQEDRFEALALRNSDNRALTAELRIGAEALVSGNIAVTYRDFKPVDPLVERYRGMAVQAGVTYPFLEVGRLSLSVNRDLQYSFDATEAYYVETSGNLAYTHRLFGEVDVQVRGSKSIFDYGYREGIPARRDSLDAAGASVGYNLRNRTRVAVNYEVSRRRSPVFVERNYDRTRIFLSWAYAF